MSRSKYEGDMKTLLTKLANLSTPFKIQMTKKKNQKSIQITYKLDEAMQNNNNRHIPW